MKHGRLLTSKPVHALALLVLLNELVATLAYVWSLTGSDCDPYNDFLTWFALPLLAQLAHWFGNMACYG